MLGKIAVRWAQPQPLPARGLRHIHAESTCTSGRQLSVPLGTPVSIPDLPVGTAIWTVEVNLAFDGTKADRFSDPAELAKLGNIVVDLDQVRTGKGFN